MVADGIPIFLLTRGWRDTPSGIELTLWAWSAEGPVRVVITGQEAVLFVRRGVELERGRQKEVDLCDLHGHPVNAAYFSSRRDLFDERDRLRAALVLPLESDVKPVDRFLMERFITSSCTVTGKAVKRHGYVELRNPSLKTADVDPCLSMLAFDIETDGIDGPVISIAGSCRGEECVFIHSDAVPPPGATCLPTERAVIQDFAEWTREIDPDVLTGWNVVDFDLRHLVERSRSLGFELRLGRGGARATVLEPRSSTQPWVARVPGRVVLDGIATFRSATWSFENWSLDHVSHELLGRGKAIDRGSDDSAVRVDEIRRLYREDLPALAEYNLEDCRLVLELFERASLVEFAIERQRLTGLPMDRQGGSVAAFDYLYLPRLHRAGYVAPDPGVGKNLAPSPGGHVMESEPGFYDNVVVLDFKSLYPSIIRTFCIDPMGLAVHGDDPVGGFEGAHFNRDGHILPGLIETLWTARDEAKRARNAPLSQAIKILMNSFYGVLGTPACRFHDPRLASSITRRGHEILMRSRTYIEERGLRVLYGDTDSLFVLLGPGFTPDECERGGQELAAELNVFWRKIINDEHRLESALEVEFETHFIRFLVPMLRGSDRGTKKRYAGTERTAEGGTKLLLKGLEAVRTDWTPLARRFQRELYERIFAGEPYEEFVRKIADDMYEGLLDDELVYRKRLRQDPAKYMKNVPPHVQAAKLLDRPVRVVAYLITTTGPQPVEAQTSPLDYDHYLDRQLAPAADGILRFLGTDLMDLAGRQMTLF